MRSVFKIVFGKPERNRSLGRPLRKWEDVIRMELKEMVLTMWVGLIRFWIKIGGGLLEHDNEHMGVIKGEEFLD